MMTTKYFRNLLTAVVCLLAGMPAQAQFKGSLETYPATDWGNEKPVSFNLSEVAAQLGTDAATLAATFESWVAEGSEDADIFFLRVGEELSTNYTQGGKGGFWVNADGAPQAWSDDNSALRWFNTLGVDAEADVLSITVGQFPAQCQVGDTFSPTFVLKVGDKEATFDVTLSIVEKPSYELPEPMLLWQQLDVVADVEVATSQVQPNTWHSDPVTADLNEALAKLGVDNKAMVADELPKMLYATRYYLRDDVALGGAKHDSLTNAATAGGLGFWLHVINDEKGVETSEVCANAYASDDAFYIENFKFDAETGILTGNLGQQPSLLAPESDWFTYMYLIYGSKAIRIKYSLHVEEPVSAGSLEELELKGEADAVVEQEPTSAYEAKIINVDVDAIAATLGCQVADLSLMAMKSDVEFGNSTANQGGYWFANDGYVTSYGSTNCCMFVEPQAQGNYATLRVGQYPNYFKVGDQQSVKLVFVGNGGYYVLNVTLKITEPKTIEGGFQSVAQRTMVFQQEPAGYAWCQGLDIPEEWIADNIGTSSWTLYGLAVLDEDGNEPAGDKRYVKNYTMAEAPGFWLDKDGRNSGHGDKSVFGLTAGGLGDQPGKISMIQMPDKCQVGDVYKTQVFFVNEDDGRMVTVNLVYNIVEEVIDFETVGTESLTLPVAEDDTTVGIDLSKAAEALGVSVDDLLSEESQNLHGMTESGVYSGGYTCTEGLAFNKSGFFDQVAGLVFLSFEKDGDQVNAITFGNESLAEGQSISTQLCFRIGEKQYVYDVKFVTPEEYATGISTVAAATPAEAKVYDLSGRQVKQPARGLYIVNGKKIIVK